MVRHIRSAAYKLLRVACDVDDMTFSVQAKAEWDLCGGVALLAARGMTLVRLDDAPVVFNQPTTRIPGGFVAGLPHLMMRLAEQMHSRRAAASTHSETPC